MDMTEFEQRLTTDGFAEIETKSLDANRMTPEHEHPFDVRALITGGAITLGVAGEQRTYRAGDVFVMASGCRHTEAVGPDGVQYLVGRRRAEAAAA